MSTPAHITPIGDAPARKSDEILKRLVERRATLKADAEYIADELETIDAQLLELLGGEVGTHQVGQTKVEVREYSRLDTAWIEEQYPVWQYPQLYKVAAPTVDAAAVKKHFAPAVLDEHKVRGAKSIVIR